MKNPHSFHSFKTAKSRNPPKRFTCSRANHCPSEKSYKKKLAGTNFTGRWVVCFFQNSKLQSLFFTHSPNKRKLFFSSHGTLQTERAYLKMHTFHRTDFSDRAGEFCARWSCTAIEMTIKSASFRPGRFGRSDRSEAKEREHTQIADQYVQSMKRANIETIENHHI